MASVVVVGAQWGDEGKGKLVDLLTERARYVVRFHGGNNAGHTLIVEGEQTVVHLVPSGVLHAGIVNVIGNGVVVDPSVLLQEVAELRSRGRLQSDDELRISLQAHVVMPYHVQLDRLQERARGQGAIGTTCRGIGPCYEDKAARRGIRVGDLMEPKRLQVRVEAALSSLNPRIQILGGEPLEAEALIEQCLAWGEKMRPFVAHTSVLLNDAIASGERVLFEGAQGVLLDIDHGTYPYVTSSSCVAGGACVGAGIPPTALDAVLGIAKAYTTRVGSGPFPSEMEGALEEELRQRGGEFGATTGRPRRCGWLDIVALRHAVRCGGLTSLALTKLDVLSGLKVLKACVGYEVDGQRVDSFPCDADQLERCVPIYEELPGWEEDLTSMRGWDELPDNARSFIGYVEQMLGVPVSLVSVGPGRAQIIRRADPFEEAWRRRAARFLAPSPPRT